MYNRKVCLYRKGTPSIIRDSMKLRFNILLALCFILINEVYAQGYEISSDRTIITVSSNCSIPVELFAPSGVHIYGDRHKGGVGSKKNKQNERIPIDLFSEKTAQLNNNPKGISFKRDDNGVATVVVDLSKINDKTIIKFYQAISKEITDTATKKKEIDWRPDVNKTFQVTISKDKSTSDDVANIENNSASLPGSQTIHNTLDINEIRGELEALNNEVGELKKGNNPQIFNIIPLLIALLITLLIGYFLYRQNRKVLIELSKECSDLRKVVDNWEKRNNTQAVSHQTTQQKSKGKSSMTDDEIKRFIVEQIKSSQTHFSPSTLKPTIATNSNLDSIANSVKKVEQTTDTDNVKYHQEDNSFSLEQTDIKIFRIYSKKGEYYYTIVDDSAVREELIGMLQMFEGCITYQTTDGVAKRVEPVTEGKLRKDGNKFYVDANNKLVVKFA